MARMTEEEAWALDDAVTRADITLGPKRSSLLTEPPGGVKMIPPRCQEPCGRPPPNPVRSGRKQR